MLKGIHLTLMIGPVVAVPVSQDVLDALTNISVTSSSDGTSGFQMTFRVNNNSPLNILYLLSGGAMIPMIRVIIVITMNGTPDVLMDGVLTNHQLTPDTTSGYSLLTLTGEDLSKVMDYIDFSGVPFPAMPAEARVLLILAKYAALGIIPMVIPSVLIDIPLPSERIPLENGKDLAYIKKLADDVGYVFYIDPGPQPGISIAYWGPEIKAGQPQPALNINMDGANNTESLNFTIDSEKKTLPVLLIQDLYSKIPIPIPIPDITPLNPPLGIVPLIPKNIEPITDTAKLSPVQAAIVGLTKAAKSSDAVFASGKLNVLRYGHILKARKLVGVRGAGLAFDGLYYVKSVTHDIKPGEYTQSFNLSRNGLVSTFQKVSV